MDGIVFALLSMTAPLLPFTWQDELWLLGSFRSTYPNFILSIFSGVGAGTIIKNKYFLGKKER